MLSQISNGVVCIKKDVIIDFGDVMKTSSHENVRTDDDDVNFTELVANSKPANAFSVELSKVSMKSN